MFRYVLLPKLSLLFLLFSYHLVQAQEESATQTVYGLITDNATKEALSGVSVELLNFVPLKTAISDESGRFALSGIPVGKQRLLVMLDGYEILIVPEIEVQAGQQSSLDIGMEKIPQILKEVTVRASKIEKTTKDVPINHMALTGIRSFTIEEVKRYPASVEDPARLVSKFAGVSKSNSETGLLIRGNNTHSLLWRLEGLPIPSPNHLFFKEGVTGYLPIFNIYLLRNSDFMYGNAPAEYGNTIGGILDLGLRAGNTQNFEGSFKMALTGAEGFLEGPLGKKGKASFIAGGRYSLLSLLSGVGGGILATIPNTGDFSFKIHLHNKHSETNIFWVGGISSADIDVSELDTNDLAARYETDAVRKKNYALLGVNHTQHLLNKKGYVYTVLGGTFNLEELYVFDSIQTNTAIQSATLETTLSSYLHYVFEDKHQLRAGVTATYYFLNFKYNKFSENLAIRNHLGHSMLLQLHAQWLYKISKKIKLNVGVNGQYLLLNNSFGISPRFALSWQFLASHRLSLGYSWNHQIQHWETYLNSSNRAGDMGQMPDYNLGFSQNHHFSLTYDWAIINNWRLKVEGYYQYLTNIPVNLYTPQVSLINISGSENLLEYTHFDNSGKGQTYGVELTLEKFFSEGYYGLLTATYFDAKYSGKDGIWRNTETNNYFLGNFLVGKEFLIGPKKNNSFFMDLSYTFKMGNYYTPVDLNASVAAGTQVLDWNQAYTKQHPHFHNLDFRVGLFFNHKKVAVSHKIFIEVGNLLNQKIVYREAYNPYTQTLGHHRYAGFLPNLSYRLNFGFKKKGGK